MTSARIRRSFAVITARRLRSTAWTCTRSCFIATDHFSDCAATLRFSQIDRASDGRREQTQLRSLFRFVEFQVSTSAIGGRPSRGYLALSDSVHDVFPSTSAPTLLFYVA